MSETKVKPAKKPNIKPLPAAPCSAFEGSAIISDENGYRDPARSITIEPSPKPIYRGGLKIGEEVEVEGRATNLR